jgi:hypothetical protein
MNEHLKGRAKVVKAFHWTGENSHVLRQFAAAELLDRLKREDEDGPFHVLAHSHGGTALFHALTLAVEQGLKLDHLLSWTTIGTPFIFYHAPFGRVLRAHLGPAILFGVIAATIGLRNSSMLALVLALGIIVIVLAACGYLATYSTRRVHELERETIRQYGSRWVGIRSKHDEAIALLRGVLRARPTIMSKRETGPLWSYTHPAATRVPGRIPRQLRRRIDPSINDPAFWVHPRQWLKNSRTVAGTQWRLHAREWLLLNLFFWPIMMLLDLVSLLYNHVFTTLLDRWTIGVIVTNLLGEDSPYFEALEVSDVPLVGASLRAADLPAEIEEALFRQANSEAEKIISELRQSYVTQLVLSPSSTLLRGPMEFSSTPMTSLTHCLYFDIPACRELMANIVTYFGSVHGNREPHTRWVALAREVSLGIVESI